jgi:uncharacterized protein (TIGR00369 family)
MASPDDPLSGGGSSGGRVPRGDPQASVAAFSTMDGDAFLRAIRDGRLPSPPLNELLRFVLVEVGKGSVLFVAEVGEHLSNGLGVVHGGALATLCDGAIGCAVHSTLPKGTGYTTLELTTRFLRPVLCGQDEVRCAARVRHRGRRTAVASAEVLDADDRLLCEASATVLLLPLNAGDRD